MADNSFKTSRTWGSPGANSFATDSPVFNLASELGPGMIQNFNRSNDYLNRRVRDPLRGSLRNLWAGLSGGKPSPGLYESNDILNSAPKPNPTMGNPSANIAQHSLNAAAAMKSMVSAPDPQTGRVNVATGPIGTSQGQSFMGKFSPEFAATAKNPALYASTPNTPAPAPVAPTQNWLNTRAQAQLAMKGGEADRLWGQRLLAANAAVKPGYAGPQGSIGADPSKITYAPDIPTQMRDARMAVESNQNRDAPTWTGPFR